MLKSDEYKEEGEIMKKILVIDDNEDILSLVERILTKEKYSVDC